MDPCQQCQKTTDILLPVKLTNVSLLAGHVMVGGRGGREQTYTLYVCAECLENLSGVPGGESVRVEPDLLAL